MSLARGQNMHGASPSTLGPARGRKSAGLQDFQNASMSTHSLVVRRYYVPLSTIDDLAGVMLIGEWSCDHVLLAPGESLGNRG